ncbi:MAG: non-canonical purine NTP pyrophosphatase [Candidatus Peregrinibacteria bacterium]
MQLLLGTNNRGKIIEISEVLKDLPIEIVSPRSLSMTEDPEESGKTFEENAIQKAKFYFSRTGLPTVADDSGIIVEALKDELGLHTRRWGAGQNATDEEWIDFFLKRMRKEKNKRACFICTLAYISSPKTGSPLPAGKPRRSRATWQAGGVGEGLGVRQATAKVFEGRCSGVITDSLEADYLPGLPISACFKPDGFDCVFSALKIEQKNSTSHRGRAALQLAGYLRITLA